MFAPRIAKAQSKTAEKSNSQAATQHPHLPQMRFGRNPVEELQTLQRTIGNQAVLRLLAREAGNSAPNQPSDQPSRPGLSWDFSKVPVHPPGQANCPRQGFSLSAAPFGVIQRKLEIGAVNDPLEHEADRVAEQVMRMPEPNPGTTATGAAALQRKCMECKEEEEQEHRELSRKESSGATALDETAAPPIVHEVLRSPGQPLDAATRAFMEPRFGHDFSRVRVHTDSRAAESAGAVKALAYAVGREVVFGQGRYNPRSTEGQRLLAHELTHVAQQARPDSAGIPLLQRAPDKEKEKEKEKPAPEGKKEGKKGEAPECDPNPAQLDAFGPDTYGLTVPNVSNAKVSILKNATTNSCITKVISEPVLSFDPFIYVKDGDYTGKITPTGAPCKGELDAHWHITKEVSALIRDGEIEHCKDAHRAFDLTHAKYLAVAKELESGFPGDKLSCSQQFSKIVLGRTGIEVSKVDDVFKCLVKNAIDTRDKKPNQWHTLHLDRFAKYSKDCKSVTYNPDKTALPEVNKHRSEVVISDKVVEGCKKL